MISSAPSGTPEPPHGRATLVVGAGGFLGQEIVRALSSVGGRAVGLVRTAEKAARVSAEGGLPVVGDILDASSLLTAARGCSTLVHVASAWNDPTATPERVERVRVEGVRNLVRVAAEVRARRVVVGSGYWVYPGSSTPITEATTVVPDGESRVNYTTEQVATEEGTHAGLEVLIVRPGMVYGDGAWFRPVAEGIRDGTYRTIAGGSNYWSFVALPDAGTGFRSVVESGRAGETYNLVDGSPERWGEFAAFVAGELGRPAPATLDATTADREFGPVVARHLAANRFLLSTKLRSLGWVPRFASYRDGLPPLLRAMRWA